MNIVIYLNLIQYTLIFLHKILFIFIFHYLNQNSKIIQGEYKIWYEKQKTFENPLTINRKEKKLLWT